MPGQRSCLVKSHGSKVRKFYISPAVEVISLHDMLRKHIKTQLHFPQVDSGEGGRQSKMVANSRSYAVSLTAYAGANGNLYAVWEMACSVKGLIHCQKQYFETHCTSKEAHTWKIKSTATLLYLGPIWDNINVGRVKRKYLRKKHECMAKILTLITVKVGDKMAWCWVRYFYLFMKVLIRRIQMIFRSDMCPILIIIM